MEATIVESSHPTTTPLECNGKGYNTGASSGMFVEESPRPCLAEQQQQEQQCGGGGGLKTSNNNEEETKTSLSGDSLKVTENRKPPVENNQQQQHNQGTLNESTTQTIEEHENKTTSDKTTESETNTPNIGVLMDEGTIDCLDFLDTRTNSFSSSCSTSSTSSSSSIGMTIADEQVPPPCEKSSSILDALIQSSQHFMVSRGMDSLGSLSSLQSPSNVLLCTTHMNGLLPPNNGTAQVGYSPNVLYFNRFVEDNTCLPSLKQHQQHSVLDGQQIKVPPGHQRMVLPSLSETLGMPPVSVPVSRTVFPVVSSNNTSRNTFPMVSATNQHVRSNRIVNSSQQIVSPTFGGVVQPSIGMTNTHHHAINPMVKHQIHSYHMAEPTSKKENIARVKQETKQEFIASQFLSENSNGSVYNSYQSTTNNNKTNQPPPPPSSFSTLKYISNVDSPAQPLATTPLKKQLTSPTQRRITSPQKKRKVYTESPLSDATEAALAIASLGSETGFTSKSNQLEGSCPIKHKLKMKYKHHQ